MSSNAPLAVSVTRTIAAEPNALYDVISDITNMHKFSPENTGGTWLGAATGPAVGARFKGTNQLGKAKWSTKPTVTAADRGVCFAFRVPGRAGAEWSYHFEAKGDATVVTESMRQEHRSPVIIRMIQRRNGVHDRASNLRAAMELTLERIAASVCGTVCPSSPSSLV